MRLTRLLFICLLCMTDARGQHWQGTYQTTYGIVKLIEENGKVYGDYGDLGTITAITYQDQLHGIFHNGKQKGKFVWKKAGTGSLMFRLNSPGFAGYWQYDDLITLDDLAKNHGNFYNALVSSDPNLQWNGERSSKDASLPLRTAVWAGTWNTTYGVLQLEQVGMEVTGLYSDRGGIRAAVDPKTGLLKGTFTNKENRGFLEFHLKQGRFNGKWGWTPDMTEKDPWSGEKPKTAVVLPEKPLPEVTNARPPTQEDEELKIQVTITRAHIQQAQGAHNFPGLYGFAGVELKKVTRKESRGVSSFGNKSQYFFNLTSDQAMKTETLGIKYFAHSPVYERVFYISRQEWEDPETKFELRLFHHLKGEVSLRPNYDYKYHSEIFDLGFLVRQNKKEVVIGKDYVQNEQVSRSSIKHSKVTFKIQKF